MVHGDNLKALKSLLPWDRQRQVDSLAPTHVEVPSGSRVPVDKLGGHYHDTYEKVDDRWLVKSTKLTRLRLDVERAEER